jgi:VIT1/CCC1 family predicted Fe2+/Mn2+ transporter
VLVAGVAGLVAGATSMAAGEYVSVSSQRDAEQADIARERWELAADPDFEQAELAEIYVRRGLDRPLATTVAERLMEADPLASHVRDELGLQPGRLARPLQAQPGRAALRVTLGGGLAMGLTALIGQLVGATGL